MYQNVGEKCFYKFSDSLQFAVKTLRELVSLQVRSYFPQMTLNDNSIP